MAGVRGLTSAGQPIQEALYEYQVCYRCHSQQNFALRQVDRVDGTGNIAHEFSPANASYHPVDAQGRSSQVPSLLPPRTTTDILYCTDCHTSNDATGPKGPHGSIHSPLLAANYTTILPTAESPQAYALCYTCHDRNSILNNQSFAGHNLHVV